MYNGRRLLYYAIQPGDARQSLYTLNCSCVALGIDLLTYVTLFYCAIPPQAMLDSHGPRFMRFNALVGTSASSTATDMDALLAMPGAAISIRYIYMHTYINKHTTLYTATDMEALLTMPGAAFSIRYTYVYINKYIYLYLYRDGYGRAAGDAWRTILCQVYICIHEYAQAIYRDGYGRAACNYPRSILDQVCIYV